MRASRARVVGRPRSVCCAAGGQVERPVDRLAEGVDAEGLEGEPDLDRAAGTGELEAPIGEVDAVRAGAAPGDTRDGARRRARAWRPSRTSRQPTSNGIASHLWGSRVMESASSSRRGPRGRDRSGRRRRRSAVHVEPDPALATERGELGQGVDGPGVGRAGVGDDEEREAAGGDVGIHGGGDVVGAKAERLVGGQDADLVGAEARGGGRRGRARSGSGRSRRRRSAATSARRASRGRRRSR